MAACLHCRERKGKRGCPALGGSICTPCCGEHRLKEIACPPDCGWLGGLAVVRDPRQAGGLFTREDYHAAFDKLVEHAGAEGREAISKIIDDGVADEWEIGLAFGYMCHGWRDGAGRRLVDRFLSTRGRLLPVSQVAALVALGGSWASLFEVESVQTGVGMGLADLLSGESIQVREISLTSQVKRWDVLFAWVLPIGDHLELTGAGCVVPRIHLKAVRAALDDEIDRLRRRRPGVAQRDLVGEAAWAPLRVLRRAIADFRLPELRTMHGDKLLFCKAHYDVRDEDRVRRLLGSSSELEEDDAGWGWVDRDGHPDLGEGPLSLGQIRLGRSGLVLETMSRERLERGRRLIESTLGDLVEHRADSIQSPEAALREHADDPRPPAAEIPEDVQRELMGRVLSEHYRGWLDEPLPALGGKTPRKATRTRAGRARVEALLKDIENGTLRQAGGDTVDFAGMRRELGLAEDEPATIGYDAARAPDAARWLRADERRKQRAVEKHHDKLGGHPAAPDPRLHAVMHVIVENQIAAGEPKEVPATVSRLMAAGLTRHEAVHAVGSVVAKEVWQVLREHRRFDREWMAGALESLEPEPWENSAP